MTAYKSAIQKMSTLFDIVKDIAKVGDQIFIGFGKKYWFYKEERFTDFGIRLICKFWLFTCIIKYFI